jgi:hypothetical protein
MLYESAVRASLLPPDSRVRSSGALFRSSSGLRTLTGSALEPLWATTIKPRMSVLVNPGCEESLAHTF